jgi:hypothetical protein
MCQTILVVVAFAFLGLVPVQAMLITWQLNNVTFHPGSPASGPGGPVKASGVFTFDADIQTMLSWNITVLGAVDPTVDFTFTPASSFIPSLYAHPQTGVRFVRTLPGNPPENPFGTNPFDSNSVLLDLDFSNSPGNLGLTDSGGAVNIMTGGTQVRQISTNSSYGVETGSVTSVPEPSSIAFFGTGATFLIWLFPLVRIISPRPRNRRR